MSLESKRAVRQARKEAIRKAVLQTLKAHEGAATAWNIWDTMREEGLSFPDVTDGGRPTQAREPEVVGAIRILEQNGKIERGDKYYGAFDWKLKEEQP